MYVYPFSLKLASHPACQCRRQRFDSWVEKIPWRRKWQPTSIFLPGEFHGQRSLAGSSMGSQRVRHNWVTFTTIRLIMRFPGGSVVNNLPAKQETQVQFLVWKDPLEKEMLTHSSILAWDIPWTEETGGLYSSWGCKRVEQNLVTKQQKFSYYCHFTDKKVKIDDSSFQICRPRLY